MPSRDVIVQVVDLWSWRLFLGALCWAPLPYASNRPWAWSILAALMGGVAVLTAIGQLRERSRSPLPPPLLLAALTTAAVIVWAGLQSLPNVFPADWAHPVWRWARHYGLPVDPTISLSPSLTRDNLMRLLVYVAAFGVAFTHARDSQRARALFKLLFLVIALEAAYGLAVHFAGMRGTFPWQDEPKPYQGVVTGTFINRNNFATYLGLGILTGFALMIEELTRAGSATGPGRRLLVSVERFFGRYGLRPAALLALLAGALLTGSRGGFLSLTAGLLVFFYLTFLVIRPSRKLALASLAIILAAGWGVLELAGGLTLQRLLEIDETGGQRTLIYALALDAIGDRPWLGHGYGTFERVFYFYRDAPLSMIWDKAHNTYLEHAVELGVPATLILYLGPIVLFVYMLSGIFRRRRNRIFPLVAASASVLVAAHALVDFSLQIPAVAVTYATILGIGVAQSRSGRPRGDEPTAGRAAVPPGEKAGDGRATGAGRRWKEIGKRTARIP